MLTAETKEVQGRIRDPFNITISEIIGAIEQKMKEAPGMFPFIANKQ